MKAQDRHSDNCPVTVLWGHGKKFEQANGNFLSSSVSHNIFVSCSGLPSLLCLIKPPHQCSYARIFRREHLAHPNQLQGNCPAFSKKKSAFLLAKLAWSHTPASLDLEEIQIASCLSLERHLQIMSYFNFLTKKHDHNSYSGSDGAKSKLRDRP